MNGKNSPVARTKIEFSSIKSMVVVSKRVDYLPPELFPLGTMRVSFCQRPQVQFVNLVIRIECCW